MSEIPSEEALAHRLRRAFTSEDQRPVSFVLGAGVSMGATPSTEQMIGYFRRSVLSDAEDVADFDQLVTGVPIHHRYQVAAQFVIDRAGIPALNKVVRIAVLEARSPRLPTDLALKYLNNLSALEDLQQDWQSWSVPRGLMSLGRILEMATPELRSPVLTTNFDPLIEASLSAAGLIAHPVFADRDGAIQNIPPVSNIVSIVHLHGSWSVGDTLHTGTQLTRSRPRLLGSLRQILTHSTCVVLGYGGWDDLLTNCIFDLVEEGAERDIEILWGCHGSMPQLGRLTEMALPGRLQPYVGVDVNRLLPRVEEAIRGRLQPTATRRARITFGPRIVGFDNIDADFTRSELAKDTSSVNAISYFDGRPPSWIDALGDRAPVLSHAYEIIEHLRADQTRLVQLILAPTGEGKSTMIKQVAGFLAQDPQHHVRWLATPAGFNSNDILNTTASSGTLWVVIDDADLHVRAISATIDALDKQKRTDVKFLLAARDSDWSRSTQLQSANLPSRVIDRFDVGGITEKDARDIVAAWTKFGARALGRLEGIPAPNRAAALFNASEGGYESALLGAMLEIRFGNDFRQHIWELMSRLANVKLPNDSTLLEVYAAVCVFAHLGISNLSVAHLGAWMGLSDREIDGLVVARLGREAAAQRHGDSVIPRHGKIASEVVSLLSEFELNELQLVKDVIRSVVHFGIGARWSDDMLAIAYAGQRLGNADYAMAAADAAHEGDPSQLRLSSYRIGVYREARQLREAATIAEGTWKEFSVLSDVRIALRAFLLQWARVEGSLGNFADSAALNACALLDHPDCFDLEPNDAARSLNGLAWSLGMMAGGKNAAAVRGTCAFTALEITTIRELREQATRLLEEAERDGFSRGSSATQRTIISVAIKEAIRNSSTGPARQFDRKSNELGRLFQILQL